ncbi:MAG: membrane dipeptidase, partial [Gemmatimonas sp.]
MITSRNTWVRVAAATGLAVATLGGAPLTALPAQGTASDDAPLRRAQALLREVGLVDTHNDLPWVLRLDPTHPMDLTARDLRARGAGDTDLPKLRDGGVGTQFWSV